MSAVPTRLRVTVFLLLLASFPAQAADDSFQRGVDAYEAGAYPVALRHFQNARDAGHITPVLWLNMGVTAFQLERYSLAHRYFRQLLEYPEWQAIGHYHLGRVAEHDRGRKHALRHYQKGLDASPGGELEQHILAAMWGLDTRSTAAFSGIMALSVGYDGNPELMPEHSFHDDGEAFVEFYGSLAGQLPARRWQVQGDVLMRSYPDGGDLNDVIMQAGIFRQQSFGYFRTRIGAQAGNYIFINERYQSRYQLLADVERPVGQRSRFRFATEASLVDAASDYRELQGYQGAASLEWRSAFYRFYYGLDYRFEWNDRKDVDEVGSEESLSPMRNRGGLLLGWNITERFWTEVSGSFENSRYQSRSDFEGESLTRDDDRVDVHYRFGYSFTPSWQLYLEYGYTERVSTIETFELDRHRAQLSLVYQTPR